MIKYIQIVFLMIFLISCAGGVTKNDVVLVMNEFFEKVKENNFSLIEPYYSDAFFEKMNRDEWEELFYRVHSILGRLVTVELETWSASSFLGTSGSGTQFRLIYRNIYENGFAIETITVFIPRGKNEIKINGHHINLNLNNENREQPDEIPNELFI